MKGCEHSAFDFGYESLDADETIERVEEALAWTLMRTDLDEERLQSAKKRSARKQLDCVVSALRDRMCPVVVPHKCACANGSDLSEADAIARKWSAEITPQVLGGRVSCVMYSDSVRFGDGPVSRVWIDVNELVGKRREIRPWLRNFAGRIFAVEVASMSHDSVDSYVGGCAYLGQTAPGRYRHLGGTPGSMRFGDEMAAAIASARAIQFRRRYHWEVEFSLRRGFFGIAIPTDDVGARELLRLRDTPLRGRRRALVHWVRSHRRSVGHTDTARLVDVRAHLRGDAWCAIEGLQCRIHPSRLDIDRAINGRRFIEAAE